VSSIRPEAQAIIDRLRAVDQEQTYTLDTDRIERAFADHLAALELPARPVRFVGGLKASFKDVRDAAWDAAWDAARAAAWDAARAAARAAAWDAARAAAWDAAWAAAWDAAWDAARAAAWDAARDAAWAAAWDAAWAAAWDAAIANSLSDHTNYKQFRAVWMPFVDAFEAGLFVYWILQAEVVAVPRPIFRFRGEQLHGDGQPAIAYPDGERHYFWRGVRIPNEWGGTHSEHWKPEWLLEAKNAEHRRGLIQGLGYNRIMGALPNRLIHAEQGMELREISKTVDVEPIRLLKVVCPSTGFAYVLRVPPGVQTCEAARRATFPWAGALEILKET
jgi:hypothetical protein